MKKKERYNLGIRILKDYYQKIKHPKTAANPLMVLSKIDKIILKNMEGQSLRETRLSGHPVRYLDAFGFLHSYKEIFEDKVYFFESENKSPTIIDCGSNIGLSIIYFKLLFPSGTIIGFEPDPILHDLLNKNLESFHFENVDVRCEAVWNKNEDLLFETDPSLSGHLSNDKVKSSNTVTVKAIRLKEVIEKYEVIDFLKMDIESAELQVIEDIAELLPRVKKLFVEFHNTGGKYNNELSRILSVLENAGFRYYMKEAFAFDSPFTFEGKKNIEASWNPFNISAVNMK